VCCQSTHQAGDWGPERPTIGGWSLLGVMSDWQHGVDWLLAEYYRCRLRLDLCWCRWRVGAKGLSLCGLRGVERQVGSARWTRWPNEGHMVARKARRSRVRFLGWASNQSRAGTTWRPSHEWDWRGGCTESAGFAAVHHKTVGVPWLSHKAKTEGSAGGEGIRARRETSKRRTRVGITRLASGWSEVRSPGIRPMVLRREFPKCPLGACTFM
jgi:hypothetical protein